MVLRKFILLGLICQSVAITYFRSVTFAPTICNQRANVTTLPRVWYRMPINPSKNITRIEYNLEDWFASCSYGKMRFTRNNNPIVAITPASLQFPCNRNGWRWPTCNWTLDDEMHKMAYNAALDMNFTMTNDVRINVIKPFHTPNTCRYTGLATTSCTPGFCGIWMNYNNMNDANTIMAIVIHEFGHTFGLAHVNDRTDPMGGGSNNPMCFSPPNSARLNWSQPISIISTYTTSRSTREREMRGVWHNITLPIYSLQARNHIRIDTLTTRVFIAYRTGDGYDSGLEGQYKNKVHVYANDTLALTIPTNNTSSNNYTYFTQNNSSFPIYIYINGTSRRVVQLQICVPFGDLSGCN